MSKPRNKPWYASGLPFECTSCGNCCTGPEGAVWFDDQEGREMAENLGMSEKDFLKAYTRKIHGNRSLNEHETEHGFDCVFLDRETRPGKAICSIYEVRPVQCRTWPFWPEVVRSRAAWRAGVLSSGWVGCVRLFHRLQAHGELDAAQL